MRIEANARTISKLLFNEKFEIDFYQREYSWQTEHVSELIDDLTTAFLHKYEEGHKREEVPNYSHYFLGSIIISHSEGKKYIVDGQQRFTTLTLLLIRLYHLLEDDGEKTGIEPLIYSQSGPKKGFNLHIDDWIPTMEQIYPHDKRESVRFDVSDESESIQNICSRYNDIENYFEFQGKKLLFFIDWLLKNVYLVEITAYETRDAYAIFEAVNDRGLPLTPSNMLRGYLLSNIRDPKHRESASEVWSKCSQTLNQIGKNEEAEAIKAWLRCQYAQNISNFDEIGSEFHRWVGKNKDAIGLRSSNDFADFIEHDFKFYIEWYCRLRKAANSLLVAVEDRFEHVYYNAQHNKFTLQYPFLLATLSRDDPEAENMQRVRIAAEYLDILLYRRIWNSLSVAQNTMANLIPQIIPNIRGKNSSKLADILHTWVQQTAPPFTDNTTFSWQGGNRPKIFLILARMTDYIGVESGESSRYSEYMRSGKNKYEIEHIWAARPKELPEGFDHESDFEVHRNRIGGLLLLPKSDNASSGDDPYSKKLKVYAGQNLLAQSLHENAYVNKPGFRKFREASGLDFKPHNEFNKKDLDERQELYLRLAEQIWNPSRIQNPNGVEPNTPSESVNQDTNKIKEPTHSESVFSNQQSTLIPESFKVKIREFYKEEYPDKVEAFCNLVEELYVLIDKEGWDGLTHNLRKVYFAYNIGSRRVFGVHIDCAPPKFAVWVGQEEADELGNLPEFDVYYPIGRNVLFREGTSVETLRPTLEKVYKKLRGD